MFHIATNLPDLSELKTLTPDQLFDPRHNPTVVPQITVGIFLAILKTFYTRQNITKHPEIFFPKVRPEFLLDCIKDVPDKHLPALHFIRIQQADTYTHTTAFIPTLTPSYSSSKPNNQHLTLDPISKIHEKTSFPEQLVKRVKSVHTALAKLDSVDQETPLQFYELPAQFICSYAYMIANRPYIETSFTEALCTREQILTAAITTPNLKIVLTFDSATTPAVALVLATKDDRRSLYKLFEYSRSPLRHLDWPLQLPTEHKPLHYGVELEISTDYSIKKLIDACETPFFIAKSDRSVTGSKMNNYELCTVPTSLKAHAQQWAHFFSNLDYEKFDQTKDTNNGMHVHIAQSAFDTAHKRRFVWFLSQHGHRQFLLAFSERTAASFNEYSALPGSTGQRTKDFLSSLDRLSHSRGCVYVSRVKPTIEVRLFRGIVSLADILKNLEFVDSVYHFTKECSNTTVTLPDYTRWLTSTPANKYKLVKEYITSMKDLDIHIALSVIEQKIGLQTQPIQKAVEILNTSGITLTQDYATALNRHVKKRIVVFDKTTSKLKLSHHNLSPLHHLNREIEKRLLHNRPSITPPAPSTPEPLDTTPTPQATPIPRRTRHLIVGANLSTPSNEGASF